VPQQVAEPAEQPVPQVRVPRGRPAEPGREQLVQPVLGVPALTGRTAIL
jgi:hypothetical protein